MKIAIHQPSFIPHFPFFDKMAQCDKFVILTECQFEKNNTLNRQMIFGKWWTKPVENGNIAIMDKRYTSGQLLLDVNLAWIVAIAKLLEIDTKKIVFDIETDKTKTERIIEICKHYKGDEYLASAASPDKYLDIKILEDNGIKFVPMQERYKKHVFELINEHGVEGVTKILKKNGKPS